MEIIWKRERGKKPVGFWEWVWWREIREKENGRRREDFGMVKLLQFFLLNGATNSGNCGAKLL